MSSISVIRHWDLATSMSDELHYLSLICAVTQVKTESGHFYDPKRRRGGGGGGNQQVKNN